MPVSTLLWTLHLGAQHSLVHHQISLSFNLLWDADVFTDFTGDHLTFPRGLHREMLQIDLLHILVRLRAGVGHIERG